MNVYKLLDGEDGREEALVLITCIIFINIIGPSFFLVPILFLCRPVPFHFFFCSCFFICLFPWPFASHQAYYYSTRSYSTGSAGLRALSLPLSLLRTTSSRVELSWAKLDIFFFWVRTPPPPHYADYPHRHSLPHPPAGTLHILLLLCCCFFFCAHQSRILLFGYSLTLSFIFPLAPSSLFSLLSAIVLIEKKNAVAEQTRKEHTKVNKWDAPFLLTWLIGATTAKTGQGRAGQGKWS